MSCINNEMDVNVFIKHPSERQVGYALTEEEIIDAIRQEEQGDNPEDDSTKIQKVVCQEAINILEKLEIFWLQEEDVYADQLIHTHKLKDMVATLKNKSLSATLERYFVPS